MKLSKNFVAGVVIAVAAITVIGLSGLNYIAPSVRTTALQHNQRNQPVENPNQLPMEKIFIRTQDGVKIAVNLYEVPTSPVAWIIFSHMMPAAKESWDNLARGFQSLGYEGLAIDLRGHGESDGGPNGYQNFSDKEHQASINDLESVTEYLIKKRGAAPQKIIVIGASIGANLSLEYLARHPESPAAVLLSAGLNYHGVRTEPFVKSLKAGQKIFFVSSQDDGRDAAENQKLYDETASGTVKQIKIYNAAGHGTSMFQKQPDLEQLIINFLTQNG